MPKNNSTILFSLVIMLTSIGFFSSCSLIDPASPVPTYLQIDSIHLETDPTIQGSNSSKITDAWVFVDQKYIGTFPLPAKVPIIADGTHEITIRAGIIENGISSTRSAYPKFTGLDTIFEMHSNNTYAISPTITYNASTIFTQMEDFDDASVSFSNTANGSASLTILSSLDPNAFEGNSGVATVDSSHLIFETASTNYLFLPLGTPVYIEMNYKSDVNFIVGDFITTGFINQNPMITLRASSTWKKVYLNMSDLGAIWNEASSYKIYFRADKSSTAATSNIYFDNIKVVY
ncbi:MAG: hypothetical protein IPP51_08995 [Bacteroidetes bacterium]|nr:hypothetical protein [Bacteroidota bacterium]